MEDGGEQQNDSETVVVGQTIMTTKYVNLVTVDRLFKGSQRTPKGSVKKEQMKERGEKQVFEPT